jgi:nucleoside 2-deoxyribosyltransferase
LLKLKTPTVFEKAEKLMLYIAKQYRKPGEMFRFNENDLMSITWSNNSVESDFIFSHYLIREMKYIDNSHRLTPSGWEYLYDLQKKNTESEIAFVAMWFNDKMETVYENTISLGIKSAGYKPLRIDKHEHINKIDDEIVAMIKRSRFVVADFTGQRGGVYFEAGYALGMGLPVIWTCREDHLKEVHFDNRQYNFIVWKENNPEQFKKDLQFRIEAVIGKGNYSPQL